MIATFETQPKLLNASICRNPILKIKSSYKNSCSNVVIMHDNSIIDSTNRTIVVRNAVTAEKT